MVIKYFNLFDKSSVFYLTNCDLKKLVNTMAAFLNGIQIIISVKQSNFLPLDPK